MSQIGKRWFVTSIIARENHVQCDVGKSQTVTLYNSSHQQQRVLNLLAEWLVYHPQKEASACQCVSVSVNFQLGRVMFQKIFGQTANFDV